MRRPGLAASCDASLLWNAVTGHPLGLFPSHADAPRVVVTNGMVVPNYSSRAMYERMYATGDGGAEIPSCTSPNESSDISISIVTLTTL